MVDKKRVKRIIFNEDEGDDLQEAMDVIDEESGFVNVDKTDYERFMSLTNLQLSALNLATGKLSRTTTRENKEKIIVKLLSLPVNTDI